MASDYEEPRMVVVMVCGYRAKCVAPECGNVAKAICRYSDAGGRPIRQEERCGAHTAEAIAAASTAGLTIHDDRKR